jgi:hypothetical protein
LDEGWQAQRMGQGNLLTLTMERRFPPRIWVDSAPDGRRGQIIGHGPERCPRNSPDLDINCCHFNLRRHHRYAKSHDDHDALCEGPVPTACG